MILKWKPAKKPNKVGMVLGQRMDQIMVLGQHMGQHM